MSAPNLRRIVARTPCFSSTAAKAFAASVAAGECSVEDLTEESFSDLMYSVGVPDPELIIRPSGELRLSNFLLWQSAYSEFVYMNVLWPDFRESL